MTASHHNQTALQLQTFLPRIRSPQISLLLSDSKAQTKHTQVCFPNDAVHQNSRSKLHTFEAPSQSYGPQARQQALSGPPTGGVPFEGALGATVDFGVDAGLGVTSTVELPELPLGLAFVVPPAPPTDRPFFCSYWTKCWGLASAVPGTTFFSLDLLKEMGTITITLTKKT